MVINIDPRRINLPSGAPGRMDDRRRRELATPYVAPKRADVNYIPSVESLRTLISSAVAALRQGVRWDRGTILNLLV